MPSIFKSLSPTDYSIVPFPAYYKYAYTYEWLGVSNPDKISVAYGSKFTGSELRVPNNEYELFDFISQSFYSEIPYVTYGIKPTSYTPSQSVYVINISQRLFGEKVLEGSFSIQVGTSQSYDDGQGNLIASSSGTGSIVGRIFYDKGIALFQPTSSVVGGGLTKDGLYLDTGTTMNIYFSSSVKFYENTYRVKLSPNDFLFSNNPTIFKQISGSSQTVLERIFSQSLLPYVTTIGFYNANDELVLVAKPSVPIQRTKDITQTFIIRYDI